MKQKPDPFALSPVDFPQTNCVLKKPPEYHGDCGDLRVHSNGETFVSQWRGTIWQRILLLIGWSKLWLVILGETHPPVALSIRRSMFEKPAETSKPRSSEPPILSREKSAMPFKSFDKYMRSEEPVCSEARAKVLREAWHAGAACQKQYSHA